MPWLLKLVALAFVVTSRAAPSGTQDGDIASGAAGPVKASSTLEDAVQQLEALKHHSGKDHPGTERSLPENTSTELAVQEGPEVPSKEQERDIAAETHMELGPSPRQLAGSGLLPFSKEYTKRAKPMPSVLGSRREELLPPAPLSVGMPETTGSDLRGLLEGDSINYTPEELAMYIYKTGDEDGVILAIEELMAQRVMSISDALNFLRQIRDNLRILSEQEEELKDFSLENQEMSKKNRALLDELDYEALSDRARSDNSLPISNNVQEQLYTEFSLEEVIYQLARLFIAQANRYEGDAGSARALQDVAALLEKEVARGTISRQMEREVLDVIVTSLVDTMSENAMLSGPGPFVGGTGLGGLKAEELLEPKKREDAALNSKKSSDKRGKE